MILPPIRKRHGNDAGRWADEEAIPLLEKLRTAVGGAPTVTGSTALAGTDTTVSYNGPGGHTITLAPAASAAGRVLYISHNGTAANGLLRVERAGTDTIGRIARYWMGPGDVLVCISDGVSSWAVIDQNHSSRARYHLVEDFVGSALAVTLSSAGAGSSASWTSPGTGTPGRIGVAFGGTGSTSTGYALAQDAFHSLSLGQGAYRYTIDIFLSVLSSGTERYIIRTGFVDEFGAGDGNDSIMFRYSDDVNGGRWEGVCRAGSIETVIDTGVSVSTGWQTLEFIVNGPASSVEFFVQGESVGVITTNIPKSSQYTTLLPFMIEKTVGTTSRNCFVDIFTLDYWLDVSR